MSWERGEGVGQRRRSTPLVVLGIVLALVVVGVLVRQGSGGESEQLTVERTPSPRPSRTVEPATPARPARIPSPNPSEPGRIEPLLLGPTGLKLHAVDLSGRLLRADLDRGEVAEADVFEGSADTVKLLPDGQGGVVVVPIIYGPGRPTQSSLHVAALDQPPVDLGTAAEAFASGTPDRVWLFSQPNYYPGLENQVREVAYDGTVTAEATLPPGIGVLGAVEGGLLVNAAGSLVLYDPAERRGQALGPGQFVAAAGRWLARRVCDAQLRCPLVVGPIADSYRTRAELSREAIVALELLYSLPQLSADGTRLALLAVDDPSSGRPFPAVVDLTTGQLRRAPEGLTASNQYGETLAWAPSGDWVFVASGQSVLAWNVDDDRVVWLDLGRPVSAIAVS